MIFFPINALAVLSQSQALYLFTLSTRAARRVQSAKAANQNIVVGNLGVITTGAQTATPVNVGPT